MNKKSFRLRPSTLLATCGALILSSCNRGVGCPTNFSLDVSELINVLVSTVTNFIF
jgi:hypothetical protein